MKIQLTLTRGNVSAVAEINENAAPTVSASFLKLLPLKSTVYHARWGGNEIWTSLPCFEKYEHENETCIPTPGDICVVPTGENAYDLAIWYGAGWIFGPEFGFRPSAIIGHITSNLSNFAIAANDVLINGKDTIIIDKL